MSSTHHLLEKLIAYSQKDVYPFHMPGHKRNITDFPNPWSIDITEIDGFDNLHHAQDILLSLQERAAKLFHSSKSFCLVNGSTCGILAAVSACITKGGKFLMARNCHKSVYHSVFLKDLTPTYFMPEITEFGIMGQVLPETVEKALQEHPDAEAVLIVSPTYDGVASDIRSIAAIAHKRNIPLIVDEAHGAHFPFHDQFPESALSCNADVVIHSLHKTLPAFTQTALLHLNSKLIREEEIRRYLNIYQSSSPSYLLMASMDYCIDYVQEKGEERFRYLLEQLHCFYEKCRSFQNIHIYEKIQRKDPSKILFSAEKLGLSGQDLSDILRKNNGIELEMASGHYALALSSLMDTQEGFTRLYQGLLEIDTCSLDTETNYADMISKRIHYTIPKQVLPPSRAIELEYDTVPLPESLGFISQEYAYLYPPGIPLLVPGEQIDETFLNNVHQMKKAKLPLEGLSDLTNQRINVVNLEKL